MRSQLTEAAEATHHNDYSLVRQIRQQIQSKETLYEFVQTVFGTELSLDALFHGLTIIIDSVNTSLFGRAFCRLFAEGFADFKHSAHHAVQVFATASPAMCQSLSRELSRFLALVVVFGMSQARICEELVDFSSVFSIETASEILDEIYFCNDYEAFDEVFIKLFQLCVERLTTAEDVELVSGIMAKLVVGAGRVVCAEELREKSLPCAPVYRGILQICTQSNFVEALFSEYDNCETLLFALSNICSLFSDKVKEQHRAFVRVLHSETLQFLYAVELKQHRKFRIAAAHLLCCQAQEYRSDIHESGAEHLLYEIIKEYDHFMLQTQETTSFVEFATFLELFTRRIQAWNYQTAQGISIDVDSEYLRRVNKQCSLIISDIFMKPAALQICHPDVTSFWQEVVKIARPDTSFIRAFVDMVVDEADFLVNCKFVFNICSVNMFLESSETQEELVRLLKYMFGVVSELKLQVGDYITIELFIYALTHLLTNIDTADVIQFNLPDAFIQKLVELMKFLQRYAQINGINRTCDVPSNYEQQDIEQPNYFETTHLLLKLLANCTTSTPTLLAQLFDDGFCTCVPPKEIINILELYYQIFECEASCFGVGEFMNVYMHIVHIQLNKNTPFSDEQLCEYVCGMSDQFLLMQLIHQISYDFQHSLGQLFWLAADRILAVSGSVDVVDFVLECIHDIILKFVFDIENTALLESFSSRFSPENLRFVAEFLGALFVEAEGRNLIAAPLLRIVSLVIRTASEQLCSEDEIVFDSAVSATAYACETILADFLEESFLFNTISTLLASGEAWLGLELLQLLLEIPPTREHYEAAEQAVVHLVQENLSGPLRGEGRVTERDLGMLLSKADNPIALVSEAYEEFCAECDIQADSDGLEHYLESNVRIDSVCCILLPDELRRLVEAVKKFCFR